MPPPVPRTVGKRVKAGDFTSATHTGHVPWPTGMPFPTVDAVIVAVLLEPLSHVRHGLIDADIVDHHPGLQRIAAGKHTRTCGATDRIGRVRFGKRNPVPDQFVQVRRIHPMAQPGLMIKLLLVGCDRVQIHLIAHDQNDIGLLAPPGFAGHQRKLHGGRRSGGSAGCFNKISAAYIHFTPPFVCVSASNCMSPR